MYLYMYVFLSITYMFMCICIYLSISYLFPSHTNLIIRFILFHLNSHACLILLPFYFSLPFTPVSRLHSPSFLFCLPFHTHPIFLSFYFALLFTPASFSFLSPSSHLAPSLPLDIRGQKASRVRLSRWRDLITSHQPAGSSNSCQGFQSFTAANLRWWSITIH